MAGVMGVYGHTAYTPTKYAIVGFTDVLRAELFSSGIRFSLVLPPDAGTPRLAEENLTKPEITKRIYGTIRPLSAEKVARTIVKKANGPAAREASGGDGPHPRVK